MPRPNPPHGPNEGGNEGAPDWRELETLNQTGGGRLPVRNAPVPVPPGPNPYRLKMVKGKVKT